VLSQEDLNSADQEVLDQLQAGRVTPSYLADRLETDRSYLNQRLKRLVEHGHVDRLAAGLYELVDDPRKDDTAGDNVCGQLQGTQETRNDAQARTDRLTERIDELETQLDECRNQTTVDTNQLAEAADALQRGLDRLPADAPGRTPIEDAEAILQEVIDDAN